MIPVVVFVVAFVEHKVGEVGIGDGIFNVVGVADGDRVAQGYGGFNGAGLGHYLEAEAVGGVPFHFRGGTPALRVGLAWAGGLRLGEYCRGVEEVFVVAASGWRRR